MHFLTVEVIWKVDETKLETVYKVAICPRAYLLYKQIYFTKDLKSLKNGVLGIEIPTF